MMKTWDILDGTELPVSITPLLTPDVTDHEILKEKGVVVRCAYEDGKAVSALISINAHGHSNLNYVTDGSVESTGMLVSSPHRHFTELNRNPEAYAAALGVASFRAIFMQTRDNFIKKRYRKWTTSGWFEGYPVMEYHVDV